MGTETIPLGLIAAGEQARIIPARGNPARVGECRAEDMGLRAGKVVQVLANSGGGPLLVKVDEARLAVARRTAMTIFVRRQP